jgi:hypothetical protein
LQLKSDSNEVLLERILFYERQLQTLMVSKLMSDHGGEFDNAFLQDW